MSIFEKASREKFRFPSTKGELSTEQLWDLPLQSARGADLDTVAKGIAAELRGVTEESFVATATNPAKPVLEAKLEVVKRVIEVKLADNETKRVAAAKAAEKAKLIEILARKQDASLENLSEAEILAKINTL